MAKENHYKILQVDPSAEQEVIEAAYKRLATKYHPDKNNSSNATSRMQDINSAYSVLKNQELRQEYDSTLLKEKNNFEYKYRERNNTQSPRPSPTPTAEPTPKTHRTDTSVYETPKLRISTARGISLTILSILFFGFPGLFLCIFGAATALGGGTYNLGSDSGSIPPSMGFVFLCLSIIFMLIPIGVGFFMLRKKPEADAVSNDEPLPPVL